MSSGGKRPPLREWLSLFQGTIAREGVTTGAGAGAGTSIIDAGLIGIGANSYVSMLMVVYPGDFQNVDSMDITAFNNATGEVTLNRAYKGVAAAIPAGIRYKIVAFRFVPAEVAALTALVTALMADVGDASAATLGSILGIIGDPAQTFVAMVGYEGATSLADKLTAVRAGYLDELDFDLQGALNTIAGYIDAEVAALLADVGDASAATLGSILGILGDPAQTFLAMIGYEGATALAAKLTAARAGYLDELAAANIPADIDTIKGLVDSAQFTGPMSYLDAGGEQTVRENVLGTRRRVWLNFSSRNMTQTGTFRVYFKVDGANYDLYAEQPVTVGAGDERAFDAEFTVNQDWKLTYEEDVNEGAARDIPYNVIIQAIE